MILKLPQKTKLLKALKKIGFFDKECDFIFDNFTKKRIEDVLHYLWWLSKLKSDPRNNKAYVFALFRNFDIGKTYLEYQSYLKNKKISSIVTLKEKKSYTMSEEKIGDDKDRDSSPKNILDFIRYDKKDE